MYSSKDTARDTLASVGSARARRFLLELANLRNEPEAGQRFRLNFVGLWPVPGAERHARLIAENISRAPGAKSKAQQIDEMLDEIWILPLRDAVRILWVTPDPRTKQWGILRILNDWVFEENRPLGDFFPLLERPEGVAFLPPPSAFERALIYLQRHRTAHCANPECPAPYFFPKRSRQKYCSEECAVPAQQQFKRNWWAEHGDVWRKERVKRKSRTK